MQSAMSYISAHICIMLDVNVTIVLLSIYYYQGLHLTSVLGIPHQLCD